MGYPGSAWAGETAMPTLAWFDRFDERLGTLTPVGALVHAEELRGEDSLSFECLEAPAKGDRIVWRDGGAWREHVVASTQQDAAGPCAVYAESSLCDLLGDYIEERRVRSSGAAAALSAALEGSRWAAGEVDPAIGEVAGATFYHTNCLAALRKVERVWGCEAEAAIAVEGGRVSRRSVSLRLQRGADRGLRLEYGLNLAGCTRRVLDDEVYTALWGWGAGAPAVDEETGEFTGGYRRRVGFAEMNGGVGWLGDEEARRVRGLWDAARSEKVHRFGEVVFPDEYVPARVMALTRAALKEAAKPKVSYEVDAGALHDAAEAGLGDAVAVVDAAQAPAWRLRERVVRRVREFGDKVRARLTLGAAGRTAWESLGDLADRLDGEVLDPGPAPEPPGELAARVLLLDDDTLEFNYVEGVRSVLGGTVAEVYEVDPAAAYGTQADMPWYASGHLLATAAYIDGSWAGAGTTSCAHWFDGFTRLVEVRGLEALSGIADASYMFAACSSLESVYAAGGFDGSALTSATYAFNGCPRLVGGHDCYVPAYTDKASVCHTGAGGAFTDPADDNRTWVRGRLYADWQAEVSLGAAQAGREVASEWRLCAAARYRISSAMPWNAQRTKVASVRIADDMAQEPCPSIAYWFYSLSAVTSFEGLANLKGLENMRYAFTGCSALEELDLRGLDPSALQDLFYAFGSCGALRTITVDAGWELPAGASGTNAFYSCKALVGGAGTAYDGSRTSAAYMRIDGGEGAEGYLTAG